jgi:hypothetical protein
MRNPRRAFLFAGLACLVMPALPAHAEQAAPDRQQRLTSAESYLPMPTLSTVVMQRYATSGTLVLDMGIDVQEVGLRDRARMSQPRLVDALRTALASFANTYYRDQTLPDLNTLTRLLQTSVDRTLGRPGARVLLTNLLYQARGPR